MEPKPPTVRERGTIRIKQATAALAGLAVLVTGSALALSGQATAVTTTATTATTTTSATSTGSTGVTSASGTAVSPVARSGGS